MQILVKDPKEALAVAISQLQQFAHHLPGCHYDFIPHDQGEIYPPCDCGLDETKARIDQLLHQFMGVCAGPTAESQPLALVGEGGQGQ